MAASYDPRHSTQKDWARSALGDRDCASAFLQDETIEASLAAFPTYSLAIANLAGIMIAEIEQEPDSIRRATGTSVEFQERLKQLRALQSRGQAGAVVDPTTGSDERQASTYVRNVFKY